MFDSIKIARISAGESINGAESRLVIEYFAESFHKDIRKGSFLDPSWPLFMQFFF